MGFIPENQINDLKDRLDIVDVISEYVNLKRAGSSFKGLCPFHHEKTPSFSVSQERNSFHCFGCHEGGDAISFIMKIENLTYIEAIRFLADKMGITLEEEEYSHSKTQKKQRMYDINSIAARFYMKNLLTHNLPQKYMVERGLKKRILKYFYLGYAKSTPDRANDDLVKYLRENNISDEEMVEIGLAVIRDGRIQDKFVERLIFPIIDNKTRVIGFGARTLINSKVKYLNSPESEIFIKGKNIYGVDIVNKSRNRSKILLVEGYMDVIGLFNQGIDYAVATLGTALTSDQANLVKRYGKDILIAYDGDTAGIKATLRAIDIFKNMDVNLGIIELPDGLDPDEYIIKYGREAFASLEKKALKPIDFKLQKLYESHPDKLDFIKEIIDFLATIEGNTIRDLYINKTAEFIGTSVDSLRQDVRLKVDEINRKADKKNQQASYQSSEYGYRQKERYKKNQPSVSNPRDLKLQKEVLLMSMINEATYKYFKKDSDIIEDPKISALYSDLKEVYDKGNSINSILEKDLFVEMGLLGDFTNLKASEHLDQIARELEERITRMRLIKRKAIIEQKLKENGSDSEALKELADIMRKLT